MTFSDFETHTKTLISKNLKKELGKTVKVRQQHAYTSQTGNTYKIDVSFLVNILGVDYLTLVECKYWNKRVDREKVGYFKAIIDDLKAQKGIIVTTKGFQKGAIEYARSQNIALILLRGNKLVVLLYLDLTDFEIEQIMKAVLHVKNELLNICYN